jgi:HSP20 family protein
MARITKTRSEGEQKREPGQQRESKLPAGQERGEPTRARRTFRPLVDIYEIDEGVVVVADVPGADPDNFTVSLEGRELTLRAAVDDDAPRNMSVVYREYEIGDYERRFQLSGDLWRRSEPN